VLWGACSTLVVANVINIGADLGGMAEATQLVTGIRSLIWILFYAFLIIGLLFWTSYRLIARIFKWMTLVLFALCVRIVLFPRQLEVRAGGDVRAPSGVATWISGGACGDLGNHDFPLSLLLAGSRRD
jgi:Mn2+/Fe2+ NRAMP family transporter